MYKNLNKFVLAISFIIVSFLFSIDIVNAAEVFNVCEKSGIVKVFQIVGFALFVIKIFAPIALMAFGAIDFGKAVLSSDENAIKNATSILVKRAIASVVVFFIPTILSVAISLIDNVNELDEFDCLSSCIKYPTKKDKCKIPDNIIFEIEDDKNEKNNS